MSGVNSPGQSWGARMQIVVASIAGGILAFGSFVHLTTGNERVSAGPRAEPALAPAIDPASDQLTSKGGLDLVWSDEFDGGEAGATLDQTKWSLATGDRKGWGVGGLAYFDPANARLDGKGTLVISATENKDEQKCWYGRCKYRSSRIQTAGRFDLTYGRFAARVRFPLGQGIFPAVWLQSKNQKYGSKRYAEIDITEVVGAWPDVILGAAHQTKKVIDTKAEFKQSLDTRYHVVGVDWTPEYVRWWVDGKPYGTLKRYEGWSFDQPMNFILSLQVGGDWQGPPTKATKFPADMLVDWVRVYQSKPAQ